MNILTLLLVVVVSLVAPRGAVWASEAVPDPYTAIYSVRYRGLHAGRLHFELKSTEPGMYIYESRPEPSLLARLVVSGNAFERSVLEIDETGVRPLYWLLEDGRSGHEDDGVLEFSWDEGRITGEVEKERVDLPLEEGLQDRLSIQIAVMTALQRGNEPGTIPMISKTRIKPYSYTRAGTGRMKTEAGEFTTVVYEGTRPGSSRLSRIWHVPELGYIPARAEQQRDGKVETVMELVEVRRGG